MKFWNVVKEVSAQPVRKEARRLFVLALAGEAEFVGAARMAALGPGISPAEAEAAAPFIYCATPPYSDRDERKLRHADLLVSLPGGPSLTDFRPADTLLVERPDRLVQQVLTHRPDLRVPLGRRLPGFRDEAAARVIRDVSRINAEFAALSGISQSIPLLAPLFPAVSGADILILTKNQVLMIFRLAAIYGESLDLKSRAREIAPVIGSGFGWRAIARQLLGFFPGGLGLPVRAAMGYTGTYAVGRAAQMVFDEGRRPTREEMLRIYEEGAHLAKGTVAALKDHLAPGGSRKELGTPSKALPPPMKDADPEEDAEPAALDERAQ